MKADGDAEKPEARAKRSQTAGKEPAGERLNRSHISARLVLDRRTVHRYLSMEGAPQPDAKKRYDFAAARKWIFEQSARKSANAEEMKALADSMKRMEHEDMALDLAEKRGRLVDRKKIEPAIAAFCAQLTEDLRNKFEFELPPKYEGLDRAARAKVNADAIDWILERLKSGAAQIR